jgi:hypothetical protein
VAHAETLQAWTSARGEAVAVPPVAAPPRPATLRARLQHMPPVQIRSLWQNPREAPINLERSLAEGS